MVIRRDFSSRCVSVPKNCWWRMTASASVFSRRILRGLRHRCGCPPRKPPALIGSLSMGESAALGDPEPAFGAGRYLEVLLRERFPQGKIRGNQCRHDRHQFHAILPIARECARQDGDLWIVYMGNNEMVGPFGAATVFGAQAPPWQLVRLNLAIQKLRLGQLLAAAVQKLKGKNPDQTSWSGMKMFAENLVGPNDARKQMVYGNFERNLRGHFASRSGFGCAYFAFFSGCKPKGLPAVCVADQ